MFMNTHYYEHTITYTLSQKYTTFISVNWEKKYEIMKIKFAKHTIMKKLKFYKHSNKKQIGKWK